MFEKGTGMSFFIFADFFEKGLFPCVGHFGGNPPPTLPLSNPPAPVSDQAENPKTSKARKPLKMQGKLRIILDYIYYI
jgi:hypothetical protein